MRTTGAMMTGVPHAAARVHGLAGAVLHAQRLLRTAATPDGLRVAATSIADAAGQTGCSAVVAASPSARGAVAAAVLLSSGALTEADDADVLSGRADKVLVVEVAAVTGLHVRARVCSLRQAGAAWVGLVVLHDVGADGRPALERFGPVDHLAVAA